MGVLLVAGAGEGLGRSIALRFAREGYRVALAARDAAKLRALAAEVGGAAFPADLSVEADVASLFERVETELGPIDAVAFVAATRIVGAFTDISFADFEAAWRQGCANGFLVAREAARRMLPRGRGTVLFTGNSGSLRGTRQQAAFAAAKGALRYMAQSMARELGPRGIHVATVILDGAIDSKMMWRDYRSRMEALGADGALSPDAVAETYWQLHCQPRNAWTFEVDLRPWSQTF
ncbi:MAG TPA: SDR family NAD(P)-dependent oxidoreductase [Burkholderiales bacterium]